MERWLETVRRECRDAGRRGWKFALLLSAHRNALNNRCMPPGWRNGLGHCIAALAVPPETLGSCPDSVATGRSVGRRTIGLASSGLGRVWPVGISLSHRTPATPVAGRAQCTLAKVARCTVFPPTHWCGWLPGWMRAVLRSSVAWLGCVSEDTWLSTFVSPARTGVVAMSQYSNY